MWPADQTTEPLLRDIKRLEAEALAEGETTERGKRLLREAAHLRVRALGSRKYPVAICDSCYGITGWRDSGGRCDICVRRAALQAAYKDPHGGWVVLRDLTPHDEQPRKARMGPGYRLDAILRPRLSHRRKIIHAWMQRVTPDETGPVLPEEGYEVEGAERYRIDALDASGMIIAFRSVTNSFRYGSWIASETTRLSSRDILVPQAFSAGLSIESLVDAWEDYRAAIEAFNRDAWRAESARREELAEAATAQLEIARSQRGVLEMLDDT
jgi:hypothetical protein